MLLSSSYLSYSQILWWCNFREALLTLCLHIFQPGNRRDLKEDTRQFYAEIDLEVKTLFIWRLIVFLLFYTFNVFPWTKTIYYFFPYLVFGMKPVPMVGFSRDAEMWITNRSLSRDFLNFHSFCMIFLGTYSIKTLCSTVNRCSIFVHQNAWFIS